MGLVVITGADGFIGSHLCRVCIQSGEKVVALVMRDSPTLSRITALPNVQVIECDFRNLMGLSIDLPEPPFAFYHLAWAGVAPESRDSFETQLQNLSLCMDAVRLAHRLHAGRFILPGSTMEYLYGDGPITGHDFPTPQNVYGAVKVASRFLCESLAKQLGLSFIYAIITGVYGADRKDNNVIYYVIDQLLSGKKPALTKLEQQWDYIHIDDLTRALLLLGQRGLPETCYVIGHGDNVPLSDYIMQIRDIINPELPLGIGEVPYTRQQLPRSGVDLSKLRKDTDFSPRISFPDGIREVIKEIKEQRED